MKKEQKKLKKESKILGSVLDTKIDPRAVRWLLGHEEKPSSMEIINYKRGRDLDVKVEDMARAWDIIDENRELFEKI